MVATLNAEAKVAEATDTKTWKITDRAKQAIKDIQGETEKRMKDLMARGETYGKESLHSIQERFAPAVRVGENLFHRAKENAEWLQERVEEAVNKALSKLHLPTPAELTQLMQSVSELTQKVDALAKTAQEEVKGEISEVRKGVEKIGRRLGQVELRVRKLSQAKSAKPARKNPE
jgi:archaellum component FlaC